MKEIERKYIADLNRSVVPCHLDANMDVEQGYIIVSPWLEWRVRKTVYHKHQTKKKGTAFYAALKFGNGYIRREYEFQIREGLFKVLARYVPNWLYKTRWTIRGWEIDIFQKQFRQLVLAEYEVARADTPAPALPPCLILLKDVTERGTFANKNLSRMNEMQAKGLVARTYDEATTHPLGITPEGLPRVMDEELDFACGIA